LSYNKDVNDDFSIGLNVGASTMNRYYETLRAESGKLPSEGLFFLNAGSKKKATEGFNERETRSMYGFGQVAYKNMLFVDFTARNDWSSTLTAEDAEYDNSYFYPSVSVSGLVSEMAELPAWVSFAKVRGSWAKLGKATDPYNTSAQYILETWNFDILNSKIPTTLVNKDLRPEMSTSWEVGADFRLFTNRIGLDFTYYNEETKNQIIAVPLDQSTGYEKRLINAGLVPTRVWK